MTPPNSTGIERVQWVTFKKKSLIQSQEPEKEQVLANKGNKMCTVSNHVTWSGANRLLTSEKNKDFGR